MNKAEESALPCRAPPHGFLSSEGMLVLEALLVVQALVQSGLVSGLCWAGFVVLLTTQVLLRGRERQRREAHAVLRAPAPIASRTTP